MYTLYMMVGLPGCGKSTWIKNNLGTNYTLYSTDDYLERMAEILGVTYTDVFSDHFQDARFTNNIMVTAAIKNGDDVVWDQTNMSLKSRAAKLSRFTKAYRKICVLFPNFDIEFLHNRMLEKRPEKVVPVRAMQDMLNSYVEPTLAEGFDEIIRV